MLSEKNCLKSFPIKRLLIFLPPLLLKWKNRHFSISAQPFCAYSFIPSGPLKDLTLVILHNPYTSSSQSAICKPLVPETLNPVLPPHSPTLPSVVSEQHQAETSALSLILPVPSPHFKSAATSCQCFHQNRACDPASFSPV